MPPLMSAAAMLPFYAEMSRQAPFMMLTAR